MKKLIRNDILAGRKIVRHNHYESVVFTVLYDSYFKNNLHIFCLGSDNSAGILFLLYYK